MYLPDYSLPSGGFFSRKLVYFLSGLVLCLFHYQFLFFKGKLFFMDFKQKKKLNFSLGVDSQPDFEGEHHVWQALQWQAV